MSGIERWQEVKILPVVLQDGAAAQVTRNPFPVAVLLLGFRTGRFRRQWRRFV